ncbi:MAG: thioredoxin [Clostridia bacterium]|nr:thioredoxin [Clostridia bacterium]
MSIKNVTSSNFSEIRDSEKTVLIDFYASWCGPCRMLSPIIDEIAEERPDITVGKINVDEEQELSREFGIVSIPTVIVLKGGKVVSRVTGARPKAQLLSLLEAEATV